jgi:hypothetical protein
MKINNKLTARLVRVERATRTRIAYADARVSNGSHVTGLGFATPDDPTGKYDALWDLVQVLGRLDVEVE